MSERVVSPTGAYERYEALAAEFYDETGMMAPGKDDPLGTHEYETRVAAWRKWVYARVEKMNAHIPTEAPHADR